MTAPRDWRELSHDEMYAAVQTGPGAGASMAAEAMWRQLAEIVDAAEKRMHTAVGRSADGWQGEGGDAARSGLHALNSWALDAANDARITLSAVLDQGVSAGRLRASLPAPNTDQLAAARTDVDDHPGDAGREWELYDQQQQALARDEDARRKMEQYHWLSNENRGAIDFWSTPPTVLVEVASTAPAGGGGVGPGGSGGTAPGALPGVAAGRAGGPDVPGFAGVPAGPLPAGVPGGGPDPLVGAAGPGAGGVGPSGAPAGGGSPNTGPSGPGPGSSGPGTGVTGPGSGGAAPAVPGSAGPGPVGLAPGSLGSGSGSGSAGSGQLRSRPSGRPGGGPGSEPAPMYGRPTGGVSPTGSPSRAAPPTTRGTVPPTGRDALPPGAGGRGPRMPPGSETGTTLPRGGPGASGGSGFRSVVPGPQPLPGPSPTWRDLVNSQRGPSGGPVAGPAEPAPGSRGGPGPTAPRTGLPAAEPAARSTGGGYGAGHGMYPPMGSAAGNQGEGRRRPPYLVDDSGAFEVNVPYTDPVIGGPDLPPDPRDR